MCVSPQIRMQGEQMAEWAVWDVKDMQHLSGPPIGNERNTFHIHHGYKTKRPTR